MCVCPVVYLVCSYVFVCVCVSLQSGKETGYIQEEKKNERKKEIKKNAKPAVHPQNPLSPAPTSATLGITQYLFRAQEDFITPLNIETNLVLLR